MIALLTTPFRYPPLPHGSRFGTRSELGIWYGSETPRTVFAEVAYYRLLFLEGTSAQLESVSVSLSLFRVKARTATGVDLTQPPFSTYRAAISSPVDYTRSQKLGADARDAGVKLIRFTSARDAERGVNVAAFTPSVFARSKPHDMQRWVCVTTSEGAEFLREDYADREEFAFPRAHFLVRGVIPAPAL